MFSIVCVYNNKQILDKYLLESLKEQTSKYELILKDNTKSSFNSAAQALNQGGKLARSKYIMFVHQDVELSSMTWLEDAERWLDVIPDLGIAGVAGMSELGLTNKERGRNVIKHGIPPQDWSWGNPISQPEVVQTLDECLTIVPKRLFELQQFDETICDGWDLYAVDYCLTVNRLKKRAYAIPMPIYHASMGRLTESYFKVIDKVLKKHRSCYKQIYTTTGNWNSHHSAVSQREFRRAYKKILGLLISLKRSAKRMVKK